MANEETVIIHEGNHIFNEGKPQITVIKTLKQPY